MRFILGLLLAAFCWRDRLGTGTDEDDTKVKVKDGRDVELTGCVETTSGARVLHADQRSHGRKKGAATHNYFLVGDTGDLKNHVGHMMQIKGKVSDRGDAKLTVETRTKVEREHAPDSNSKGKTEVKGDSNLPFLAVSSVKMLRASCNVS